MLYDKRIRRSLLGLLCLVPILFFGTFTFWMPYTSIGWFKYTVFFSNTLFGLLLLVPVMYGLPLSSLQLYTNMKKLRKINQVRQQNDESETMKGHVVVVLTHKEPPESLRETASAIAKQTTHKYIYLVLGQEEAGNELNAERAKIFQETLGNICAEICVYVHPKGLKGDIPGTGSNLRWALKSFAADHPSFENNEFVVTKVDAKIILHPRYLEEIEMHMLECEETSNDNTPLYFQPHIYYQRNFDDAHPFIQVIASIRMVCSMALYFQLGLNGITCYSIPFGNMKKVDFVSGDIIGEDVLSLINQAHLFRTVTKTTVLGVPVTNEIPKTLKAFYSQERRWIMSYPSIMERYWDMDRSWRAAYFTLKMVLFRYLLTVGMPFYFFGVGVMISQFKNDIILVCGQSDYDIMFYYTIGISIFGCMICLSMPTVAMISFLPFKGTFGEESKLSAWYRHGYLFLWILPTFLLYAILQCYLFIVSFVRLNPIVKFRSDSIHASIPV